MFMNIHNYYNEKPFKSSARLDLKKKLCSLYILYKKYLTKNNLAAITYAKFEFVKKDIIQ